MLLLRTCSITFKMCCPKIPRLIFPLVLTPLTQRSTTPHGCAPHQPPAEEARELTAKGGLCRANFSFFLKNKKKIPFQIHHALPAGDTRPPFEAFAFRQVQKENICTCQLSRQPRNEQL